MRRDHRPYSIKKLYQRLEKLYVRHFLRPQFEHLGKGAHVMKPWYVEIFGGPVTMGDDCLSGRILRETGASISEAIV